MAEVTEEDLEAYYTGLVEERDKAVEAAEANPDNGILQLQREAAERAVREARTSWRQIGEFVGTRGENPVAIKELS